MAGVRTAEASYHPDVVVLAAGISTPHLAARAGVTVPLEDKPGTVNILTQPLPPTLNHIIVTGSPSTGAARPMPGVVASPY